MEKKLVLEYKFIGESSETEQMCDGRHKALITHNIGYCGRKDIWMGQVISLMVEHLAQIQEAI